MSFFMGSITKNLSKGLNLCSEFSLSYAGSLHEASPFPTSLESFHVSPGSP